jgi:DNA polymerase-3 subunit delta'
VCESCRKVSSLRSELLQIICALPAGRSDDDELDTIEKLSAGDFELYMEELQNKSENPYHHISLQGANNIRIGSIRDLASKIYLSAAAGQVKVFLISEAEKMRQEAANALLKVLEEPPKNSVIILTTSKIDSLPQTIIGRCQRIYFEPLTGEQIRKKLDEALGYSDKETELAANLSMGSYTRAVELLEMGVEDIRNSAIEYLVALLKGNYADMVVISRNITAKNDKNKTKYFLFFLSMWFRDLMHLKHSGSDVKTHIANADLSDRLVKLNANYPNADLFNIILELEEAEKSITQNVQLTLILVNLSFKLKKHFIAD